VVLEASETQLSQHTTDVIRMAQLAASAFNRLDQYSSSPGNRAYCYVELTVFSLAVAETITSTHCAYPWRDGQAELAWVAGYIQRWYASPKMVTHHSTNWAHRIVTSYVRAMPLPLHQTANHLTRLQCNGSLYLLSTHADRQGVDISFTLCNFVCLYGYGLPCQG